MSTVLILAAIAVVAFLGWNLWRRLGADRILALNERRRESSDLVSRGEFVDGSRRLMVALAVDQSTFFYENGEMQASLDLKWVREIEYDNELATGLAVRSGKVLRLRSDSQTFEFILPTEEARRWSETLPARAVPLTAAATS
ncbi:MAG: hypothetical protein ACRD2J_10870 [Thermoanaerobaculia bacterium]